MRAIIRGYVKRVVDDDVAGVSAELAFRFMFATFPFAIFVVALGGFVASWLGIRDPSGRIIGAIGGDLPSDLVGPITAQLKAALVNTHPELLSVGALITLYGATTGMTSLMKAMNRANGKRETRRLALRLVVAAMLTVLGGIAIAISFAAIVGGTLVTHRLVDHAGLRDVWPWISLVRWPVSFALLVIAVAAVLRFAPDFRTPWRWAALAATAFAVVWLVVTYAFGVYVAQFSSYAATYGALAGLIVLMLWFYLTAFVLVCAAELGALLVRLRAPELLARDG
ncbi:MAG TPA: YihY/virulence factor BrkB family protein [Candidatus Limnocylindrales bacterium]